MRKTHAFQLSAVLAMVLMVVAPYQSFASKTLLVGDSFSSDAVYQGVMGAAAVSNIDLNGVTDPAAQKEQVKLFKETAIADFQKDLALINDTSVSIDDLKKHFKEKVAVNSLTRLKEFEGTVKALSSRDLDMIVKSAKSSGDAAYTKFFTSEGSKYAFGKSMSTDRKAEIVIAAFQKEFAAKRADAYAKIASWQTRDEFKSEVDSAITELNSKDFDTVLIVLGVILLIAAVAALGSDGKGSVHVDVGGGYDCGYTWYEFQYGYEDYECDIWGDCYYYWCEQYQLRDDCYYYDDYITECY